MERSLLYQARYQINNYISIRIPTIREIIENEETYFDAVSAIVATPFDMMVQLDDMKIDFTKIDDWDLFCLLFSGLKEKDLSIIFGDLSLKDFNTALNKNTEEIVLYNQKTGVVIDRIIHAQISTFLRELLFIEKNRKKPANDEIKKYLIERARIKQNRRKKTQRKSQLERYIIALVNTAEFSYNYESVLDLTIYQFYASLHQIIKKIKFDNLMIGCYAGTINMKEIDQKELDWISE